MFSANDTFLIADCHLDASRPGLTQLFTQFLNAIEGAGAVWILGDLVEYWLGDDAGNTELSAAFDALAATQAAGTEVHLMRGNRDFLLGPNFAKRLGATLHSDDEVLMPIGGNNVLLMHGDTLCTDDADYQTMRHRLRSAQWQQNFLSLSVQEREQTAQALREQSRSASAQKSSGIMDVNEKAVHDAFNRTGVHTLIHGHTHRPNTHSHKVNERDTTRIVVGDWHDDHAVVAHSAGHEVSLKTFPF